MKLKSLFAIVALTLVAGPALAHHSFAMFDPNRTITVEGTVKEFQWTNPHTWVQVVARDGSGKSVEWSIEGSSPNALSRQGWKRDSMKAGDKCQIAIHPLKDGSLGGSLMTAVVNGKKIGN